MTPLTLAAIFAAPALFPSHHPVAVWIGLGSLALAWWAWRRADEWGGCETTLRAMEAREILAMMQKERVG